MSRPYPHLSRKDAELALRAHDAAHGHPWADHALAGAGADLVHLDPALDTNTERIKNALAVEPVSQDRIISRLQGEIDTLRQQLRGAVVIAVVLLFVASALFAELWQSEKMLQQARIESSHVDRQINSIIGGQTK